MAWSNGGRSCLTTTGNSIFLPEKSAGTGDNGVSGGRGYPGELFLPVRMTVCWDSVIDKKAYETEIWFSRDTWQQMLTAYPDTYRPGKIYYRNKMIIGLPPGGKVRVWLKDNRNPVVLQNPARQFTLTGDDMLICKNVPNKIDFSYIKANGYDPFIRDFIKEKPYPYGHW